MNIHDKIDNIEIRVDKRTTLLGIIEVLSDYRNKYPKLINGINNEDYIKYIDNTFSKYRNHNIIILFNNLLQKYDLSFSKPIKLFLQLKEDFTIDYIDSEIVNKKLNNDPDVISLLEQLQSFAKSINFDSFYLENEKRYKKYLNNIKSQLINSNIYKFMSDYYGQDINKKLVVNLIPWRTYGCYGTNDDNNIYTHLCCHHQAIDDNTLYPNDDKVFDYSAFLVHEFSHSFINPIVDKYDLISEEDVIFADILPTISKIGYGSNNSILKDHIVRAITLRYLLKYKKDISYYNNQYNLDKKLGFKYIDSFLEELLFYENNRTIYPDFETFYPKLINSVKKSIDK